MRADSGTVDILNAHSPMWRLRATRDVWKWAAVGVMSDLRGTDGRTGAIDRP